MSQSSSFCLLKLKCNTPTHNLELATTLTLAELYDRSLTCAGGQEIGFIMLRSKCPRNHPLRAIVLGIWMRQFESDAVLSQGGQELAADAIKIESFTLLLILFFGPRNRCGATWEGSPEETQSSRKERRRFLWILPTAYSTTRPR